MILFNMRLRISLLFLVGTVFFLCITAQTAEGETSHPSPWQHIESRHTIIHYNTLKDLERFDDNIDYSPSQWRLKNLFSFSGSENSMDSIKNKVDAIFERVQEILDMRKWMDPVRIYIYPDKKSFKEVRNQLTGKNSRFRSWYIFEKNSIYVNARDINEGILAHEMAHAIIDHYMAIRPPRATTEILARYVDRHLYY